MVRKLSAEAREKMRIAALLRPRAIGRFAKSAPDSAELEGTSAPKPAIEKPVSASDAEDGNQPVSRRPATLPRKPRLSRKALVARVSTSIERELFAVEQLLSESGAVPAQDAETERRARTLASLARTLRELSQLEQAKIKPKADNDAIPRDLDELRRELARRMDALIADAKATYPDRPGDAVDGAAD